MSTYEAQVIAKEKKKVTDTTIMEEDLERWIAFLSKKNWKEVKNEHYCRQYPHKCKAVDITSDA